jgi:hypothetical protein
MPRRITRRTFFGLSLAALASACAPEIASTPAEETTPAPTDITLDDVTTRTCAADDA